MPPEPLYQEQRPRAAYHLRYSWAGWPTRLPWKNLPDVDLLETIRPLWEQDGMRLLEHSWSGEMIQLTFSTTIDVSPIFLAARAKGRLQHALRHAKPEFPGFSRKLSVRSVGDNRREDVEAYIASQVGKERFVDPSFRESMREFTVLCPDVDLSIPDESARGRYWYNLHVVLVEVERYRLVDLGRLTTIRDWCFKIADKKGYRISALSVMPDHLHLAVRGNCQHSPHEIALAFQNNLAFALGQTRFWEDGFYVGTFSEYDIWAIRHSRTT